MSLIRKCDICDKKIDDFNGIIRRYKITPSNIHNARDLDLCQKCQEILE